MSAHSRSEVQNALTYLLTGNSGKPLTREQMDWELNPVNGLGFGECLYLASKHPDLFGDVSIAPFMQRQPIGQPNTISEDGQKYVLASGVVSSYGASAPIGVGFPAYLFSDATLWD